MNPYVRADLLDLNMSPKTFKAFTQKLQSLKKYGFSPKEEPKPGKLNFADRGGKKKQKRGHSA